MLSVTTLCTVCALSFIAVPPKGEESSSEGGKCPVTGLLTSSKTKAAEAAIPAEVGKIAPPFELMDTNGKAHKLSDFKGKTVVLEWFCARCPYSGKASGRSVHSTGKVKKLMDDLKKVDENIVYLLIDSSSKWSKEDVIKEAKACAEA
ncbi:MAG: redoxin domain-containing protein, partial [Planctomycetota bacterium]|nr:redoxin domain-containing protein [Planctomycetota bacterium]